jgi:hypothetical protein
MTYAPPERFEIARVLSRMVGVLRRNLPVLAVLALVLSGVPSLALALAEHGIGSPIRGPLADATPLGWLFSLLIGALLQAAVIHGTISDLNGRPASVGDCLNTAVRHVLPLIGIGIATTVATVLGLLVFILPGILLGVAMCVSAPVRVVEGLGVFASMSRSADLTKGHRGAILLLFVAYVVLSIPLQLIVVPLSMIPVAGPYIIQPLVQAAAALIGAAGVASIYFELRTAKEGVGIEALAAAFE